MWRGGGGGAERGGGKCGPEAGQWACAKWRGEWMAREGGEKSQLLQIRSVKVTAANKTGRDGDEMKGKCKW